MSSHAAGVAVAEARQGSLTVGSLEPIRHDGTNRQNSEQDSRAANQQIATSCRGRGYRHHTEHSEEQQRYKRERKCEYRGASAARNLDSEFALPKQLPLAITWKAPRQESPTVQTVTGSEPKVYPLDSRTTRFVGRNTRKLAFESY